MAQDKKLSRRKTLLKKYRLIIINEDTFEERINFRISRINVFVIVGFSVILTIVLTILLIAFTPLREYIPGYSSSTLKHQATELYYKTDSLERVVENNNKYFRSIQGILMGKDSTEQEEDTVNIVSVDPSTVNFSASKEDSILREQVDQKDKYSILNPATFKSNYNLFPPAKGSITEKYNVDREHFGVDLSLAEKTPIKATDNGTVIFAEWSAHTGYVIIIEHDFGLVSVYKHNASLTKKQGDAVRAGEVIALSGNTGEFTTGPHLHFELWKDGHPVDPTEFIEFE